MLDGVGIGALPDAGTYGDAGTNTLGNIARAVGNLRLPNLERLGLGNIVGARGVLRVETPEGCFGKMAEQSRGKDSTIGHWEIAGIITDRPFPLYPDGFPEDVIRGFLDATGSKGVLGNKPASGTEIIKELGDEHVNTGFPIVYTSADSVFQIAAHEDIITLPQLYRICQLARERVLIGPHTVGRVIARPFVGKSGGYTRTANRRDFSVTPPRATVLDLLSMAGVKTIAVGKIDDLFAGQGLAEKIHTKSNAEGIEEIIRAARRVDHGFVMANLVDFDVQFGHRQDPKGFANALEAFDRELPRIKDSLRDNDILMISADHGNDPTDASTDHSREYVPMVCWSRNGKHGINIGTRNTYADAGQTVAEFFDVPDRKKLAGESFLNLLVE